LAADHQVVAFVRDPARLAIEHPRLVVVQGDATDLAAVEKAVRGADAVVSAMKTASSRKLARTMPLTRATSNIIAAMSTFGVRRLVVSAGGAAASDPRDRPDWRIKLTAVIGRLAFPASMADEVGSARAVQASDLDWTVVRMAGPTNSRPTGRFEAGFAGRGVGLLVSRADTATFMLREAIECRHLRQTVLICNRKQP
jgi:putative NADH-flavin reductase